MARRGQRKGELLVAVAGGWWQRTGLCLLFPYKMSQSLSTSYICHTGSYLSGWAAVLQVHPWMGLGGLLVPGGFAPTRGALKVLVSTPTCPRLPDTGWTHMGCCFASVIMGHLTVAGMYPPAVIHPPAVSSPGGLVPLNLRRGRGVTALSPVLCVADTCLLHLPAPPSGGAAWWENRDALEGWTSL